MEETFTLDISYAQIAVFSPDLENPFNEWTQVQVDAGYAWRSDSVSFRTYSDGPHRVRLLVAPEFPRPHDAASRMLDVTIDVSGSCQIEVASIAESRVFSLPDGRYRLRFEYLPVSEVGSPLVMLSLKPEITAQG